MQPMSFKEFKDLFNAGAAQEKGWKQGSFEATNKAKQAGCLTLEK